MKRVDGRVWGVLGACVAASTAAYVPLRLHGPSPSRDVSTDADPCLRPHSKRACDAVPLQMPVETAAASAIVAQAARLERRTPSAEPQTLRPVNAAVRRAEAVEGDQPSNDTGWALLAPRWASEVYDDDWTRAESESLDDMLEVASIDKSVVDSLECRQTLCRIVLTVPDLGALSSLSPLVRRHASSFSIAPGDSEDEAFDADSTPPGRNRYVVYVVRPGEELTR